MHVDFPEGTIPMFGSKEETTGSWVRKGVGNKLKIAEYSNRQKEH